MARVVRFHETGGPEVLQIEEVEVPPPGKGEVQIRIQALGLNRAESMFRSGQYLEDPKLPARLRIRGGGNGCRDRCRGQGFQDRRRGQHHPQLLPERLRLLRRPGERSGMPVAHHPSSLSWVEAAAIWMQYMTAYGALIDIAGLKAADTVVIPAASSSVGLAAIQIANKVGATPIALTRGQSKRQALLDAGAAHVIATDEQDLVKEILADHGRQGCQDRLRPGRRPDRRQARQGNGPPRDPLPLRRAEHGADPAAAVRPPRQSLTIRGYVLMEITTDPARLERGKQFINEGLAEGSLKPIIAKTFPLEEIVEAHRYLESNQQIGKIVVTV